MVKLDPNQLRYMTKDEFRVLTAVEMGMKNHEVVPTTLIARIAGLKKGGVAKVITVLHKNKLIFHDAKKYDGYRLTYLGYDYLALRTFVQRGLISGLGRRIGVGKESDVYEVVNDKGEALILKIHRLGRVSFRQIKNKRDYLLHRKSASWLYLARLAALREFAYMKALYDHGFVVPTPLDNNRHCVLMSKVKAYPFTQLAELQHPERVYSQLMNMIVKLAEHGLIHCDFNEFNLLINAKEQVTMIDFPQMVSTSHRDSKMYFDRDVQCIRTYFLRKFKFVSEEFPEFFTDTTRTIDLDVQLAASGAAHGFTPEELARYQDIIMGRTDSNDKGESKEGEDGDDDGEGDGEDEAINNWEKQVNADDIEGDENDAEGDDAEGDVVEESDSKRGGGSKGVKFDMSEAKKAKEAKTAATTKTPAKAAAKVAAPAKTAAAAVEEDDDDEDDAAYAAQIASLLVSRQVETAKTKGEEIKQPAASGGDAATGEDDEAEEGSDDEEAERRRKKALKAQPKKTKKVVKGKKAAAVEEEESDDDDAEGDEADAAIMDALADKHRVHLRVKRGMEKAGARTKTGRTRNTAKNKSAQQLKQRVATDRDAMD